jgi:Ca-activated chloride channel homolog
MPAPRCAGKVAQLSMLLSSVGAVAVLGAQGPPFRSGVDLVPLDVCVTDRDGRYLAALTRDDFVIFENRVPQNLTFFSAEGELPLTAVVLIDRSSSMNGSRLERAKAAATTFLQTLTGADHASVLAFNESTSRIAAFGLPDAAGRPVESVHAHGQTALFDAVLVALRELETERAHSLAPTREAIVIMSDGEDSASRNDFEEVHREVQRTGVIVYSISIRVDERGRTLPPLHEFAQLANDSGGRVIALDDWTALDAVYADIGTELRHMYRLAYVPRSSKDDGQWRALAVRVLSHDVRVRTRAGYFATRPVPGRGGQ